MKSLNKPESGSLVLIGRVSGAHGVKGELKLRPYSGEPESLLCYKRLLLTVGEEAAPVVWKVEQARAHKSWAVVKLEGCADRSQAEQLLHAAVHVYAEDLPELAEGEFYLRDLTGRLIKTEDGGQIIGRITGLLLGGAQDMLQVEDNGREYLIPLVPEFIIAIQEDAVIMSLPPGLLEINT